MAIPLAHLDGRKDGRIVGWQRIDQRGGKFQTSAITSVISSGRALLSAT
ncbi:hypothetical protein [Klebsiella pneumoniae]|nr:hypothetical protein [Klebsiella pneumoniae]